MTSLLTKGITLDPQNFVDKKAPSTKVVTREIQIVVCPKCDVELSYDFPTYTCLDCGEKFTFTERAIAT